MTMEAIICPVKETRTNTVNFEVFRCDGGLVDTQRCCASFDMGSTPASPYVDGVILELRGHTPFANLAVQMWAR